MKRVFVLLLVSLFAAGMVTAQSEPITTTNADRLSDLALLGRGWIDQVGWSPDGSTLTVATSAGIWLYDVGDFGVEPRLIPGHDSIWSVAYSSDGRFIAGGGNDGLVQVWDAATGDLLHRLEGHYYAVEMLAFSPDGSLLVSVGGGGVMLWDVQTGESLPVPDEATERHTCLDFSPDGSLLAAAGYDGLVLWEVRGHELVLRLRIDGEMSGVAFAEEGQLLVTVGSGGQVGLWDVATGSAVPVTETVAYSEWWQPLTTSPDGPVVAAYRPEAAEGGLFNVVTGATVLKPEFNQGDGINPAISVDGKLAIGYSAGIIDVWNLATGEKLASLDDFNIGGAARGGAYVDSVSATCLDFGPDNTLAAGMGGYMTDGGWTNLWDTATRTIRGVLPGSGSMSDVVYSPDGRLLATASAISGVRVWDAATGELVRVVRDYGDESHLAFSPGGALLVTTDPDGTVQLWSVETGDMLAIVTTMAGWSPSLAYSPDGKTVAVGMTNGSIELWDVSHTSDVQQVAVMEGYNGMISSLAFSPDGSLLVSTGSWSDETLRLWDVAGAVELQKVDLTGAQTVAFSPDGSLVIVGGDELSLWDVNGLMAGAEPLARYDMKVSALAINHDGTLLATTSGDGTMHLWGIQ